MRYTKGEMIAGATITGAAMAAIVLGAQGMQEGRYGGSLPASTPEAVSQKNPSEKLTILEIVGINCFDSSSQPGIAEVSTVSDVPANTSFVLFRRDASDMSGPEFIQAVQNSVQEDDRLVAKIVCNRMAEFVLKGGTLAEQYGYGEGSTVSVRIGCDSPYAENCNAAELYGVFNYVLPDQTATAQLTLGPELS